MKHCVWLLTLITPGMFAQDFQSYFEEFDVVLYQLQVNVRDRDGNHISGLTREDFKLMLDGKLQDVESMEEVAVDKWSDADPDEAIPQQARRLFVFFFDLRYTTKQGLLQARDSARNFVQSEMKPTDLVGVFAFNPLSGIMMLTNFTSDQGHLLGAIDWLGLKGTKHVVQGPSGYFFNSRVDSLTTEMLGLSDNIPDSNDPGGAGDPTQSTEADALAHMAEIADMARKAEQKIYQREVTSFLRSFQKFADGLRLIRGRKNMVWFSTGFDTRSITGGSVEELNRNQALIESGQHYNVSQDQFGVTSVQHEAQELVEALQSSGTVIFAIDTSLSGDASREKVGIQALNMFAEDTGGKVYQHYSDLAEPLSRIEQLTNNYYVLNFHPNVTIKKGKVGKVKVKIGKYPKAKIHTNRGIMVEPDFTTLTPLEKQIHISEYIGRDQLASGIPIEVNTFQTPVDQNFVKLTVSVDLRGDYFLGFKDIQRELEIHTLAITSDNDLFDRSYFQFKLEPDKAKAVLEKTGVKYFATLFLKKGDYKLKVVARDMGNGKVGSAIASVKVEDKYDNLFGPTLIAQEKWIMLRESDASQQKRRNDALDFSYPFTASGRDLIPQSASVVLGEKGGFFYVLSGDASVKDTPPQVTALVMDARKKITPIPPEALSANTEFKGGSRQVLNFLLQVNFQNLGLARGETYKFMAQFKTAGGQQHRSIAEFVLE